MLSWIRAKVCGNTQQKPRLWDSARSAVILSFSSSRCFLTNLVTVLIALSVLWNNLKASLVWNAESERVLNKKKAQHSLWLSPENRTSVVYKIMTWWLGCEQASIAICWFTFPNYLPCIFCWQENKKVQSRCQAAQNKLWRHQTMI